MKPASIRQKARNKIAEICEKNNWTQCVLKLLDCMGEAHAPAHRHKRGWYKGREKLLHDIKQWVPACQSCHNRIENNKALTKRLFLIIRGKE